MIKALANFLKRPIVSTIAVFVILAFYIYAELIGPLIKNM